MYFYCPRDKVLDVYLIPGIKHKIFWNDPRDNGNILLLSQGQDSRCLVDPRDKLNHTFIGPTSYVWDVPQVIYGTSHMSHKSYMGRPTCPK